MTDPIVLTGTSLADVRAQARALVAAAADVCAGMLLGVGFPAPAAFLFGALLAQLGARHIPFTARIREAW